MRSHKDRGGPKKPSDRDARIAALLAKERRDRETHGFYAHYVFATEAQAPARGRGPHYGNMHTHGFPESYDGQLDIQIVLPIPPEHGHGIFWEINDLLKKGTRFAHNDEIAGVLRPPYKIRLFKTTETGREVLRLIFPDKNGLFPGDAGVDPMYGGQETAVVDDVADAKDN